LRGEGICLTRRCQCRRKEAASKTGRGAGALTIDADWYKQPRNMDSAHDAAGNGDLEKVRALLAADPALVFSKDAEDGMTPLHRAAENGLADVAELLLAGKADVNAVSAHGMTPFLAAVKNHHMEVARLLLARGADVNAGYFPPDWKPLHYAAFHGHADMVELLLAHGVKVDAEVYYRDATQFNIEGLTPLLLAAEEGHKEVVALLLAGGADVNAHDMQEGWTPLHFAASLGHKEVVELLLAGKANINAGNYDDLTPLHYAMAEGHKPVVDLLLASGAVSKAPFANN
jgi:ankyrin repeat protein